MTIYAYCCFYEANIQENWLVFQYYVTLAVQQVKSFLVNFQSFILLNSLFVSMFNWNKSPWVCTIVS